MKGYLVSFHKVKGMGHFKCLMNVAVEDLSQWWTFDWFIKDSVEGVICRFPSRLHASKIYRILRKTISELVFEIYQLPEHLEIDMGGLGFSYKFCFYQFQFSVFFIKLVFISFSLPFELTNCSLSVYFGEWDYLFLVLKMA